MNRYQEALDNVKADREEAYLPYTTLADIKLLQGLVDRTVLMEPNKITYFCRNCDKEIILGRAERYCHHCGQAIDWEYKSTRLKIKGVK